MDPLPSKSNFLEQSRDREKDGRILKREKRTWNISPNQRHISIELGILGNQSWMSHRDRTFLVIRGGKARCLISGLPIKTHRSSFGRFPKTEFMVAEFSWEAGKVSPDWMDSMCRSIELLEVRSRRSNLNGQCRPCVKEEKSNPDRLASTYFRNICWRNASLGSPCAILECVWWVTKDLNLTQSETRAKAWLSNLQMYHMNHPEVRQLVSRLFEWKLFDDRQTSLLLLFISVLRSSFCLSLPIYLFKFSLFFLCLSIPSHRDQNTLCLSLSLWKVGVEILFLWSNRLKFTIAFNALRGLLSQSKV